MGNTKSSWTKLAPSPIKAFARPVLIDDTYILYVANSTTENKDSCIVFYDIANDCFPPQMIKKHQKYTNFKRQSITYHPKKKLVYVFGGEDHKCFMTYDVSTGEWKSRVDDLNVEKVGRYPEIIFDAHERLHVIGGGQSNKHYGWNEEQQKFEMLFQFPYLNNRLFGLVSDTMNDRLIMFGGKCESRKEFYFFDNIRFFNLSTNTWEMSDLKLDIPCTKFGFLFLECVQLIIIFGGWSGGAITALNTIRIIDLKEKVILTTRMKCPAKGYVHVLLAHQDSKFNIHLFEWGTANHWSIDLIHVLPLQYHLSFFKYHGSNQPLMETNVIDDRVAVEEYKAMGIENSDTDMDDLPMKQQSFKTYFYENVTNAEKYYQSFVDKAYNDLDILMEFESCDLSVLVDECLMNKMHAKHLLKNITVLKESNEEFQQWLMNIGMKKYYKQMIGSGIATLAMLEEFVCVTDFVVFLGGENDDEIEMDGIFIWDIMPKNSKNEHKNRGSNECSVNRAPTVGRYSIDSIQQDEYCSEGDEGIVKTKE